MNDVSDSGNVKTSCCKVYDEHSVVKHSVPVPGKQMGPSSSKAVKQIWITFGTEGQE